MLARHPKPKTRLVLLLIFSLFGTHIPVYSHTGKATNSRPKSSSSKSGAALLRQRLKQCGGDVICINLLMEYGGVFAADTSEVELPSSNGFFSETEVQRFQQRAGFLAAN